MAPFAAFHGRPFTTADDPGPWSSPFDLPAFYKGRLSSFGENATQLLTTHFAPSMQIFAAADGFCGYARLSASDVSRQKDRKTLAQYKHGIVISGEIEKILTDQLRVAVNCGQKASASFRVAYAPVASIPHLHLYTSIPADLASEKQIDSGLYYRSPELLAHACVRSDLTTSYVSAAQASHTAAALLVARKGAWQVGIDVRDIPGRASRRSWTNLHIDGRVVLSQTWRDRVSGRPESFQLAFTLEDVGDKLTLSLFRHQARRVNAVPFSYWSNSAFAASLEAKNLHASGLRRLSDVCVVVGALQQINGSMTCKLTASSFGDISAALALRWLDVATVFPENLLLVFNIVTNVLTQDSSLGVSVTLGDHRKWRRRLSEPSYASFFP